MHPLLRLGLMLLALVLPALAAQAWWRAGQAELEAQQGELLRLQAEERQQRHTPRAPAQDDRLARLSEQMSGADQLPARLRRMDALLQANRVVLTRATYQMKAAKPGGLGRYEIQAEIEGPYYGLRFFVRALLAADALVALESLEVARPPDARPGQNKVRSSLRLVMYVKEPVP